MCQSRVSVSKHRGTSPAHRASPELLFTNRDTKALESTLISGHPASIDADLLTRLSR